MSFKVMTHTTEEKVIIFVCGLCREEFFICDILQGLAQYPFLTQGPTS